MDEGLTAKRREALEHAERARAAGLTLSAYARREGLALRPLYDALGAIRRKRAAVATKRKKRSGASKFIALRVASTLLPTASTPLCRVQLGALVIECAEWPPAAWLATLKDVSADAAA